MCRISRRGQFPCLVAICIVGGVMFRITWWSFVSVNDSLCLNNSIVEPLKAHYRDLYVSIFYLNAFGIIMLLLYLTFWSFRKHFCPMPVFWATPKVHGCSIFRFIRLTFLQMVVCSEFMVLVTCTSCTRSCIFCHLVSCYAR